MFLSSCGKLRCPDVLIYCNGNRVEQDIEEEQDRCDSPAEKLAEQRSPQVTLLPGARKPPAAGPREAFPPTVSGNYVYRCLQNKYISGTFKDLLLGFITNDDVIMILILVFLSVLLMIAVVLVYFAATDVAAGDDGDDWSSNNQCSRWCR